MKKLMLGAVALTLGQYAIAQETKKTNVILILTDDQGFGDFSNNGNPYLNTPNMDALRENGVFFSNFHVSAVSAPTRAALMTGRYGYRTGVTGVNKSKVNMFEDEKTIAEYMKDAGYNTGLFGKWHLGYNYPMRPIDQGYDEYYAWEEMQFYRTNPIMEENGINKQYKDRFLTDVVFEKALGYIEKNTAKEEPFFMYLATYLPHTHHDGVQVPEQYAKRFDKYPELSWHTRQSYGMIEKVDEQLGLLLKKVRELGIEENTLIIFGTDNGPAECYPGQNRNCQNRYNAGLRGMKGDVYEGGIRTPFYFVWKNKLTPGTEINRFSAHVDILPTLVDLVGLTPDPQRTLDGNSLLPILKGETVNIPSTRYYYHMHRGDMDILNNEWKNSCYIEDEYKLVDGKELYYLPTDRNEENDLASAEPLRLNFMRSRCEEYLREQLNERKLKYQPNIIGNKKQPIVNLQYFEIIGKEKGWPVFVEKTGKYNITIHDIQHDDINENAYFRIEANGKSWEKKINKNSASLTFRNLDLPEGEYFLTIKIIGDSFPKKFKSWNAQQGRYHSEEYGHRIVTVQDMSAKTKNNQNVVSSIGLYDGLLD
ncbi:MAG: sulfatase-like hydrolase/transferase [Bacteroidales bacterium]